MRRWKFLGSIVITMLLMASSMMPAFASISPEALEATLAPGESISETKTVTIPDIAPRADVVFSFDLTGSMGSIISQAKLKSAEIMTNLSASGSDINYGVMSYMDYPHYYSSYGYSATYGSNSTYCGDYAYGLNQTVTSNTTAVSAAITGLTIGCGGDGPQDYTRIFYESYADTSVGWRPGAKKILLNFGDNVPHDNNLNEGVMAGNLSKGGDPGRDEVMFTSDDLDLQTVLADMAANNTILLESHTTSSYNAHWNYWTNITGGQTFVTSSGTLVDDVVAAVLSTLNITNVTNLHLAAESGYGSWVSSTDTYSGPAGVEVDLNLTITVPDGTPDGDYTFNVSAIDDSGVSYGDQSVTIHVVSVSCTMEKDFRYTNVDFVPMEYIDPDDNITGDEYWIQLPADLGNILDDGGNGLYDVDYVIKANKGTVSSTNPGQLYGVINITGAGVMNVTVNDTFDDQFDVNPGKLGGGVEVIRVNATGYAEIVTDTQVTSASVDNSANKVELVINLTAPLEVDEHLMIYFKFQTTLKHELPVYADFVNEVNAYIDETPMYTNATIEFHE